MNKSLCETVGRRCALQPETATSIPKKIKKCVLTQYCSQEHGVKVLNIIKKDFQRRHQHFYQLELGLLTQRRWLDRREMGDTDLCDIPLSRYHYEPLIPQLMFAENQ